MSEEYELPDDDATRIRVTAGKLVDFAFESVGENCHYTIGALSLALGTAAAMAKTPFDQVVYLLSRHYEGHLLTEVAEELEAAGTPMTLPPDDGNN